MSEEYTGGSVSYYRVRVARPTSPDLMGYVAECNDIIEALGMNYAEGNAFKAIWRMCAARNGHAKRGYTDGLYDAEKVVFFGQRMVEQERAKADQVIAAEVIATDKPPTMTVDGVEYVEAPKPNKLTPCVGCEFWQATDSECLEAFVTGRSTFGGDCVEREVIYKRATP